MSNLVDKIVEALSLELGDCEVTSANYKLSKDSLVIGLKLNDYNDLVCISLYPSNMNSIESYYAHIVGLIDYYKNDFYADEDLVS